MILLVFEGRVLEPKVMATLQYLFFSSTVESVMCYYGTDTYTLWKEVKEHAVDGEPDIFNIVKRRMQSVGDHSLDQYNSYQVESVYLFFDYDPQNRTIPLGQLNQAILEMVTLFDDAMDKGKIFISYPMLESVFCVDSIPDPNFLQSTVSLVNCHGFKGWCHNYLFARKPESLLFKTNRAGYITEVDPSKRKQELLDKWNNIVRMNVEKAYLMCEKKAGLPVNIEDVSQSAIINNERDTYVLPLSCVSILSAFPMFLYEYFHGNGAF